MNNASTKMRSVAKAASVVLLCCIATLLLAGCSSFGFIRTESGDFYNIKAMNWASQSSSSMEPTIYSGESVYAEAHGAKEGRSGAWEGWSGAVEAGDVVLISDPEVKGRTLIKRVVATEGQVVSFKDGHMYVDGSMADESYVKGSSYPLSVQAKNVDISYPYTVPSGCVWVMGDNRENSQDSRYFGAIDTSNIGGVVRVVESDGKYYSL